MHFRFNFNVIQYSCIGKQANEDTLNCLMQPVKERNCLYSVLNEVRERLSFLIYVFNFKKALNNICRFLTHLLKRRWIYPLTNFTAILQLDELIHSTTSGMSLYQGLVRAHARSMLTRYSVFLMVLGVGFWSPSTCSYSLVLEVDARRVLGEHQAI